MKVQLVSARTLTAGFGAVRQVFDICENYDRISLIIRAPLLWMISQIVAENQSVDLLGFCENADYLQTGNSRFLQTGNRQHASHINGGSTQRSPQRDRFRDSSSRFGHSGTVYHCASSKVVLRHLILWHHIDERHEAAHTDHVGRRAVAIRTRIDGVI
jgi:hypothetical protein